MISCVIERTDEVAFARSHGQTPTPTPPSNYGVDQVHCNMGPPGFTTREGALTFTQRVLKESAAHMLQSAPQAPPPPAGATNSIIKKLFLHVLGDRRFGSLEGHGPIWIPIPASIAALLW
jgi:hypothetical protein